MSLADQVLRAIQRHALMHRGARVLVALSGGADSVALVHLLRELETRGELALAGLAHFNHQLRGAAADEDERFCAAMAAELSLPIEIGRADVRALARAQHRSIEDAARCARYAFLDAAATRLEAEAIAVGQSRDDQAETFLLRLIRGAGPRGLAGIRPRAGRVVRPLIDISRAELRDYAGERRLAFREDATNADLAIPRNRVRHELIPYLAREFSPGIVDVLAREAGIARDDEELLQQQAIDRAGSIVLTETGDTAGSLRRSRRVEIDALALSSIHPALASRIVREVLSRLAPGSFIGFDHVERLLDLARGEHARGAVSLPGVLARRRGGRIVFGPEPAPAFSNSFRFPLSIPGEVLLNDQGWAISAAWGEDRPVRSRTQAGVGPEALGAEVDSALLKLPLAVRSRKRGDRLRPRGLGGRGKKLQDFLVDRKIARELRDSLPLVVDADDKIVWVVGQSAAEDFRVTDPSQAVIFLKARRLGGPG
jgi:tRNA(Ile)-lysidine synthase